MTEVKRKGRGPGKKPAMIGVSLRISTPVLEWYKHNFPEDFTSVMRTVLEDFQREVEAQRAELRSIVGLTSDVR